MGDTIATLVYGTNPYAIIKIRSVTDVTGWVNDRIANSQTSVSFGIEYTGWNLYIWSKDYATVNFRPYLLIEYGNPIDPSDTTIVSKTYNYANVTDVDTYNNVFYNTNIGSYNFSFNGTEANASYVNVGTDDGNYVRVASGSTKYGGIRFETKIDENVSIIQRIEILHKFYFNYADNGNSMDEDVYIKLYDNDASNWITENTDTYGNNIFTSRTYLRNLTNINVYITDNFDKYINEDGVLKYAMITKDFMGDTLNQDSYYYQVKVYYYEAPEVTPPVVDPGDPGDPGTPNPVYPDLTDDTPIISVDGEYTGDMQNVLFRNLFNFNDKIRIPTWSLVLLGGLIGVWKRRPELVIFCGLLFLFLLFFGYKLSMVAL
ncbi:MAG: hypothetical protein APG11_01286 [Candidatus Methanofastidiosum methylothiophilum]|uniref:Uncharacterized protein n=1 Tax=Candidatus Methanofastidiosum methylothiophilum TaxID=1705564 RepID=A0A150IQZ5_9EURY|nr:MAG: hypothetical protein APG11_01286 [Candidatus Methanofastidiosum methylthiophilus]